MNSINRAASRWFESLFTKRSKYVIKTCTVGASYFNTLDAKEYREVPLKALGGAAYGFGIGVYLCPIVPVASVLPEIVIASTFIAAHIQIPKWWAAYKRRSQPKMTDLK